MKKNVKACVMIIVGLVIIVIGVWAVSICIEKNELAKLAESQEVYLAQDLERLSGQMFFSELEVNACCQALNNRYWINKTYFACRNNIEEKKYEIYVVDKMEDISYANGSTTRKSCTQKEKNRAIMIENDHKDECICYYVFN